MAGHPKKSMARVLVLFAHPALEKSRVHSRLIERVRETDGVTLHDLYECCSRLIARLAVRLYGRKRRRERPRGADPAP